MEAERGRPYKDHGASQKGCTGVSTLLGLG